MERRRGEQALDALAEAGRFGVEVGVRAEGRDDAAGRSDRRPGRVRRSSSSSGSSVVASTAMPKLSNSARGRNSGLASAALIA